LERKRRKIPLNNMAATGQQKTIENMMETAEISPVETTKADHLGSNKVDGIASIKPKDPLKTAMETGSAQAESNKAESSQSDELQTLPNQRNTLDGLPVKKVAKELVVLSTEQREAASTAANQTKEASKGGDSIILSAEQIGVESVDNLLTEPNRKDNSYISAEDLSKANDLKQSQLTKAYAVETLQEPSKAAALVSLKAGSKKAKKVRTDEQNKVDVEETILTEPTTADFLAAKSLSVLPRKNSVKELDVLPIQPNITEPPLSLASDPRSKVDALLLGQGGGPFANNTDNKQDELKKNKTNPNPKQTGRPYFSSILDQLIGGHGNERTSRTVDTESGGHEWRVSQKDADDSGDLKQGESVHQFHYEQVDGDPDIIYTTDIREFVSRWDGNSRSGDDTEISAKNLADDSIISQYEELSGKSLSYH